MSISSGFWKNSLYYIYLLLFSILSCLSIHSLCFCRPVIISCVSFLFLVLFCTLNRPRNSQSAEEPKETIKIHQGHQETIDIVFQINSYSKSNLKQQIKWHNTVFIPYLFGIFRSHLILQRVSQLGVCMSITMPNRVRTPDTIISLFLITPKFEAKLNSLINSRNVWVN